MNKLIKRLVAQLPKNRRFTLPKKVAQIDVDMINAFTEVCPNELPVPGALEIVTPINKLAQNSDLRVGSKCAHPDDAQWITENVDEIGSANDNKYAPHKWVRHGVPGTLGFEMISGMPQPLEYDFFVWKGIESYLHPYGVCYHDPLKTLSTGLIEWLVAYQVTDVLVTGLAEDYCVATTALELAETGLFNVIIIRECTRAIDILKIAQVEKELKNKGVVIFDTISEYLQSKAA